MTEADADLRAENRKLRELLERHGISLATGDRADHYRRLFALQGQARDLGGRHIITGGGFRGAGHYGMVQATYPEGSRIARQDSWRCHHEHPDDLSALECALGEVRRLAGGGSYEPCSVGPGCQDESCRRDWKRVASWPG